MHMELLKMTLGRRNQFLTKIYARCVNNEYDSDK